MLLLISQAWHDVDDGVWQLIGFGLTFLAALVVGMVVTRLIRLASARGHLPQKMAVRLRRTFYWLLAFVMMAAVLQGTHLFDQAWAVVSAMLVAVALGFVALWSVLSNVVCALFILAFRPFRIGDRVEIVDPSDHKVGMSGVVSELSLMFTTLEADSEDEDTRVVFRVPNSVFFLKGVRVSFPKESEHTTFFDVPAQASRPEPRAR